MAHIKQRVPPEQPAGSPQFTREEERDGKTLNLVLMESREGMEEREVGEKRQSASVRANEREGKTRKEAAESQDGSLLPSSPSPLTYLCQNEALKWGEGVEGRR